MTKEKRCEGEAMDRAGNEEGKQQCTTEIEERGSRGAREEEERCKC